MIFHIRKRGVTAISVILVFAYVFSFYILGPVNSSMIAGLFVLPYFVLVKYYKALLHELATPYIFFLFLFQCLLIFAGYVYSVIYATYDFSYIKILFAQSIHLFLGVLIVVYMRLNYKTDALQIEKYIIYAYILQSCIQLLASALPPLADLMLFFNRSDSLQERSAGVRGLALSGATGWSLALTYGLVFIIFTKRYMLSYVGFKSLLGWGLLFVGTFFAGRTGFVGALLGWFYYLFGNDRNFCFKVWYVLKLLFLIAGMCGLILLLFPEYVSFLSDYVLPFAFEPVYNYFAGNGFTSRSTDILVNNMWDVPLSVENFFLGTGHFTNPDGSYYQYTDAGVLRNLFYWGIGGYLLLIMYELFLMSPLRCLRKSRLVPYFYWGIILLYLCLTEFKAVTLGLNKGVFSLLFLLGYFYNKEREDRKEIF